MRNTSGLKRGGSPGRPKGKPNKATVEVKEACAEIVDDPVYRRNVAKRARAGKLAPAVECLLWYYAKGKPKDHVDLVLTGEHLATLSDAELATRAATLAKRLTGEG